MDGVLFPGADQFKTVILWNVFNGIQTSLWYNAVVAMCVESLAIAYTSTKFDFSLKSIVKSYCSATWNPHYNKDKFYWKEYSIALHGCFLASDHNHAKTGYASWVCGPWRKEGTGLTWLSYSKWSRDCHPFFGHIVSRKAEELQPQDILGNW